MNYMKQVAKMFGVEMEKEFYINNGYSNFKCKITDNGLLIFTEADKLWSSARYTLADILTGKNVIIKQPILNEAEKEYLSGVIKSFRDKVKCIVKRDYEMSYENEYIFIVFNDDGCMQIKMCFPSFKKGTMYKGMEINKEYSLEDLGL